MSSSRVLHLHDYRNRRQKRFEQALALYSADQERALLLRYLWSVAEAAEGDRAAVVWVDEYGPGLVHTHVVLDFVADRPRRAFPVEPLRQSWSQGVPGLYDQSERDPVYGSLENGSYRHVCAVALGSDGLRAWFVVVDGQSYRPALDADSAGRVLFLAGECSAILLHRDLERAEDAVLVPEGGRERFAAWPVLKDIEGHEKNEVLNRRISCRFLVARVVRAILDDDMSTDAEALQHQIKCVRRELGKQFVGDPESEHWDAVLSAAAHHELDRFGLASTVLELGSYIEKLGHLSGARELYRSAYQAAMAVGAERDALDAARFAGRSWRLGSAWERALAWYQVARSLAIATGDLAKEAVVLDGMANVHKEKGNLPRARQVLNEALPLALKSGDAYAVGSTYHDMGAVAGMSGFMDEAIQMTWLAVKSYDREQDQLNALTLLAGIFLEAGEIDAADVAYQTLARRVGPGVYRLYALSGYAQVAAHRRNRSEFERRIALLEAEGCADGPPAFRAGDWIGRAGAYKALGDLDRARRCYREAIALAAPHKLGQLLIRAEEGLLSLDQERADIAHDGPIPRASPGEEMETIREELGRMRDLSPALAGV
jgi:tetratricopeptide (TPR) repeat protein